MHADVAALRKTSIWHEAGRIVKEEGFRAFWKGNLVTIVHRLPYSAVNFYAYEHYKKVSMTIYFTGDSTFLFLAHFSHLEPFVVVAIHSWLT